MTRDDIRERLFAALTPAIRDAEDMLGEALGLEVLFPMPVDGAGGAGSVTDLWRWNGAGFTHVPRRR